MNNKRGEEIKSELLGREIIDYREEYDEHGYVTGSFIYLNDGSSFAVMNKEWILIRGVDS